MSDAELVAEIDRITPGWTVTIDEGDWVRLGPMPCPRCGITVVLIERPRPRLVWWQEITAAGLAERADADGRMPASRLRRHEAWRCTERRDVELADLVNLDAVAEWLRGAP